MKRNDLVRKLNAAEKKQEDLAEERKQVREQVLAYKMMLEMSDNGQLDIFDGDTNGK